MLVHQGTLDDYDPGYTYDTITGFDVLEHVGNPSPFLSAVRRLLEADGIAFFTLPNQASVYRRCLGKQWFHYIPEEHMFYYNPGCLRRLLTMSNLEMIGWERAWKPLSLSYALIQLGEYSPIIHKTVSPFINILSERVREAFFPVYIGEMLITCRVASASAAS